MKVALCTQTSQTYPENHQKLIDSTKIIIHIYMLLMDLPQNQPKIHLKKKKIQAENHLLKQRLPSDDTSGPSPRGWSQRRCRARSAGRSKPGSRRSVRSDIPSHDLEKVWRKNRMEKQPKKKTTADRSERFVFTIGKGVFLIIFIV